MESRQREIEPRRCLVVEIEGQEKEELVKEEEKSMRDRTGENMII